MRSFKTMRVLVTGGAGGFGRALVPRLANRGYTVRILSRRPAPAGITTEWSQADIESGVGLAAALAGVDVVVHAASSPAKHTRQIDVEGTRRLLQSARAAEVAHFAYISIVGIDQIPYAYYRHKLAAEALVAESRLPWSILRATQFYTLIHSILHRADQLPLMLLPTDLQFQPIDVGEAAERMAEVVDAGPAGRLADIGGPAVLMLGTLARDWMQALRRRRRIVYLPMPGAFAAALRQGRNTCPEQRYGRITWADWLRKTYDDRPTTEDEGRTTRNQQTTGY
jgi:uncharacterized protein YbjT (DUF2867 family)